MTQEPTPIACKCGKVRGALSGERANWSNRVICHCTGCRTFIEHLGVDGVLDENGGTDLYQTIPSRLSFEAGTDLIKCLRMTKKGPARWYASCCNTPLANTFPKAGGAFVGILTAAFPEEVPGIVIASINSDGSLEGRAPGDYGFMRVVSKIVGRVIAGKIGLIPTTSPFFPNGEPLAKIDIFERSDAPAAEGA